MTMINSCTIVIQVNSPMNTLFDKSGTWNNFISNLLSTTTYALSMSLFLDDYYCLQFQQLNRVTYFGPHIPL